MSSDSPEAYGTGGTHATDVAAAAGTATLAPEPGRLPAPTRSDDGPDLLRWTHRGLTLAAVMGLAVGTRSFWTTHALPRPGLAVALSVGYLFMLVAAIITLCAVNGRTLARLDVAVLVTAIGIKVAGAWTGISGAKKISIDEGMLMDRASRTLAAGHNPYLAQWKQIDPGLPTQLMDGRTVFDFGYPPFGVELGALVHRVAPAVVAIVAVAWLALFATAVLLFRAAPVPLRPLATLGLLGLGTLTYYADNAYPSLIALPFLCVAVWNWPATGRGGALGWAGTARAVALGLACSIHQLGWFLAPFLLVGLVLLRLADQPPRVVIKIISQYAGSAVAVFLLTSAPFLLNAPRAWLTGVFAPLLQHAVPHGQGIMGFSYYLVGGSGALDWYGYATILLLLALLATYAIHLRRLGPAAVVLPWLIFWVSTRSQEGYWVLTMPLWIAGLCTVRRADFAAGQLRLPERLRRSRPAGRPVPADRGVPADRPAPAGPLVPAGRTRTLVAAGTALLFLPAVFCVGVAAATPQPLRMRLLGPLDRGRPVAALTVEVTNRSGAPVAPHFAVTTGVDITEYWLTSGPGSLPAHTTISYTLRPRDPRWKLPATGPAFLRAVSDHPQTLSSLRLAG